jgi:hypothetical protein
MVAINKFGKISPPIDIARKNKLILKLETDLSYLQSINEAPWHASNVCSSMAPDISLILYTTERDSYELPIQGLCYGRGQ